MNSKDEFREYAMEGYMETEGAVFDTERFKQDVNNLMTTKKMISRFLRTGNLNEKLMINNVIKSLNVFTPTKTIVMFKMILDDRQFGVLKSILVFLKQYVPVPGTSSIEPNRVMDNILDDISIRYNLNHLE